MKASLSAIDIVAWHQAKQLSMQVAVGMNEDKALGSRAR
jgi:hypothetical protein